MQDLSTLTVAALLLAAVPAVADIPPPPRKPGDPQVASRGMYLEGDGVTVELARFVDRNDQRGNDILVRITGVDAKEAGLDGKVTRLYANPSKDGAVAYRTMSASRAVSWERLAYDKDGGYTLRFEASAKRPARNVKLRINVERGRALDTAALERQWNGGKDGDAKPNPY